jgi:suppressor for copper-sensitivity B
LNTSEVRDLVEQFDVVPLRADWSKPSPEIETMLEKLKSASIPLYAVFPADRPEQPIVLRDLITKGQVVDALRRAGPSKGATATAGATAMKTK